MDNADKGRLPVPDWQPEFEEAPAGIGSKDPTGELRLFGEAIRLHVERTGGGRMITGSPEPQRDEDHADSLAVGLTCIMAGAHQKMDDLQMTQPFLSIPDRLAAALAKDPVLHGYTHAQLARYAPWIKSSGTPFFPGYTDHGEDHLNRVLTACHWLIADESWPLVTASDAACLVLSVLLHDSAMHLTPDSFRQLLSDEQESIAYPTLDNATWREMWRTYELETKLWDSTKWALVAGRDYGDRLKVTPGQIYSFDLDHIKESELPIIGEFIRRHHPRLAHEFATGNVGDLRLDTPTSPELLDIAGLVARSHGFPIRNSFEYMTRFFFGRLEVFACHPVFLMAVLRVADYLDLYAERAPSGLRAVRRIRSDFSAREWEAHQAVKEIRYDADSDPELIDVIAAPQTAFAHERIVGWVKGIQSELDQSWAVLGEIFGRHSRLRNLKLRLRRVATPLTDADFVESQKRPYRPPLARISLDPDALVRLLIKPLYGERPEIGVRELLQNSIDAVRLREAYSKKIGVEDSAKHDILEKMQADVVVSLCERDTAFPEDLPNDWQYWLEVTDRGIGMTEDVVRNYFLRAGASFRTSPWYNLQLSDSERSELYRIGQFGIGMLAAFLCSESMDVTTRHQSSVDGLRFDCNLSSNGIEIIRTASPIGTRIRLKLAQHVHEYLKGKRGSGNPGAENSMLDWFALTAPAISMIYRHGNAITSVEPRYRIPAPWVACQWRTIGIDGGATIQWSFEKDHPHCDIYVNGLFVNDIHYQNFRSAVGRQLRAPVINILDPENVAGLTITRERLSEGIPFREELARDILLDHIAWLFVEASLPVASMSPFGAPGWSQEHYHAGEGDASAENGAYFVCHEGLVPFTSVNLKMTGIETVACVNFWSRDDELLRRFLAARPQDALLFMNKFAIYGGFSEPRESVVQRYLLDPAWTDAFESKKWTMLVHQSVAEGLGPWTRKGIAVTREGDFFRIESGGGSLLNSELERLFVDSYRIDNRTAAYVGEMKETIALMLMEVKPRERWTAIESVMEALWKELELPPIIPFDPTKRRTLAKASERLAPYIDRYHRSRLV